MTSKPVSEIEAHKMKDPITLSGLTSLKRLAVSLVIYNRDSDDFWTWFCNLLRSGYSTSVTQHLEELSIKVFCAHSPRGILGIGPIQWKPLFSALLEDELKKLRILNIFIAGRVPRVARAVLGMLNGSEAVTKLRCQPGLILNMRGEHQSTFSELCLSMGMSFTF